ncbi:homeobox-domain-containing protein [Athelia psychrophila]|uniref:Homeobox-domain-containing protein n=1 Tax=Athelia psychrophila TaxID=1759441 RepID=A0A166QLW8_9AGAM|nr:homeobox-domain-containing protein [Fibularhizoctonia sp. CBS 109695]
MANDTYAPYQRPRRAPLHLDPASFERKSVDGSQSSSSSPTSTTVSPVTPLGREDSVPLTPSEVDFDATREPVSGPQRTSSKGKADKDGEKEKRKRSRVTPEQLVHLERFFSVDRSPTAVRRKEISELLGMQERQTQIWFQNRRAKAKLHDGKKHRGDSIEPPPDTPPELTTGYEVALQDLIHEDEGKSSAHAPIAAPSDLETAVTMIPCTDLSVGSWRRVATAVGEHDLIAYVCEGKRCLTWFIHTGGYGFKMDIPFDIIVETHFTNAAPGSGLATFHLSRPPNFYLESACPPRPDGTGGRVWKRCADWTEGMQATRILRHDLIGSAVQLAHLLRNLTINPASGLRLVPPPYPTSNHGPSPSPVETNYSSPISPPDYNHFAEDITGQDLRSDYTHHRRSWSGPTGHMQRSRDDSDLPSIDIHAAANMPRGPASASYPVTYHQRALEQAHSAS